MRTADQAIITLRGNCVLSSRNVLVYQLLRLFIAVAVGCARDNGVLARRRALPRVAEQLPREPAGRRRERGGLLRTADDLHPDASQRGAVVQHEADDLVLDSLFRHAGDDGLETHVRDGGLVPHGFAVDLLFAHRAIPARLVLAQERIALDVNA